MSQKPYSTFVPVQLAYENSPIQALVLHFEVFYGNPCRCNANLRLTIKSSLAILKS